VVQVSTLLSIKQADVQKTVIFPQAARYHTESENDLMSVSQVKAQALS
jgi:hypothetical protein